MSSSIKKGQGSWTTQKTPWATSWKHRGALGKGRPNQIKPFGKNVLNKIIVIKDTWRDAKDILLRIFAWNDMHDLLSSRVTLNKLIKKSLGWCE